MQTTVLKCCRTLYYTKLGIFAIDDAVKSLRRFAAKVDTRVLGAPRVLGVIVETGGAYRREDGIMGLPIGALGP